MDRRFKGRAVPAQNENPGAMTPRGPPLPCEETYVAIPAPNSPDSVVIGKRGRIRPDGLAARSRCSSMTNDCEGPAAGSSWFLAPLRSDPHDRPATTEIDLDLADRRIQEEYEPKWWIGPSRGDDSRSRL